MDISRNPWFKSFVAIVSALSVIALLGRVGLIGAGHYSVLGFATFALAALGLDRLLGGILGMLWVLVAPAAKLTAEPKTPTG